uniref:Cytochrome c biogenesis FC n=1 Tax=Larix sibirica TaxID=62751 RepID=A0A866K1B5_9CONI|nr:cytochrome c biogenesis FC [Larix sibirica]
MVQPQNLLFFITSMVVPRGTAAPVLLKWFVGRDVSTGAPSSSGTIIPIPTSLLPSLVYIHPRGFIRSMDEAKGIVLVGASRPMKLPNIIYKSSPETRAKDASFCSVLVFPFILLGFMGDLSYPESFRGVLRLLLFRTPLLPYNHGRDRLANKGLRRKRQTLRPNGNKQRRNDKIRFPGSFCPPLPHWERREFGPVALPVPPSSGGACGGGVPLEAEFGLEARSLANPTSRLLMAVGPGYYRKASMNMNLSHGGVCIFIMGVISTSTEKIQFTQRLPLGSELHMGKELFCLRGIDHLHGPTFHSICGNFMIYKPSLTNPFMFEHDESLRAIIDLLPIHFSSYENGKLDYFLHRERSWWINNRGHNSFWLTMFPEKRYFFSIQETTSTTKATINTNLFTDPYAPVGTGGFETGGWYTTMMKLPLIFRIRIGFLLAPPGGLRSLLRQLQKDKSHRN